MRSTVHEYGQQADAGLITKFIMLFLDKSAIVGGMLDKIDNTMPVARMSSNALVWPMNSGLYLRKRVSLCCFSFLDLFS